MKLNKILIKNFQKHTDLTLMFNKDINVITGVSDVGKSGIFRAMAWVMNFSTISENDYRTEGTKQTSVKIWLDNGCQVERIRSNAINRYILSQDNSEDKVFDNFGRETPEDIVTVLGINSIDIENEHINLNFASQDQLNFLLDTNYSDTFKAKLFNKLTGNEILDTVFKQLNKNSLKYKRDITTTEENLEKQEEQLTECSLHYKTTRKTLSSVKEKYQKIKEDVEIYEHLKELSERIKINTTTKKTINEKIKTIKIVSDKKLKELKNEAQLLKQLIKLEAELEAIDCDYQEVKCLQSHTKNIKVDFKKLKEQNNCIETYKQLYQSLNDIIQKQQTVTIQKGEQQELFGNNKKELEEIWKQNPQCPLCGKDK